MPDTPIHNPHNPDEINNLAWEKSAQASRILRARRVRAAGDPRAALEEASAQEALHNAALKSAQTQYDRASIAHHSSREAVASLESHEDLVAQRIKRLSELKPGTPEFFRHHRPQPPDPVMVSYAPSEDERTAKVTSRVWGVDSDSYSKMYEVQPPLMFHKMAGEEMTDAEYAAVLRAQYPVEFDKDRNPTKYTPVHDGRDMPEISAGVGAEIPMTEATPQERAEATQYPVRAYIPAGVGDPDVPETEHVILPDPMPEVPAED